MREINKVLALVCILREENFTKPGNIFFYKGLTIINIYILGMIDYNFLVLREAVDKVFELRNKYKVIQSQQEQNEIVA